MQPKAGCQVSAIPYPRQPPHFIAQKPYAALQSISRKSAYWNYQPENRATPSRALRHFSFRRRAMLTSQRLHTRPVAPPCPRHPLPCQQATLFKMSGIGWYVPPPPALRRFFAFSPTPSTPSLQTNHLQGRKEHTTPPAIFFFSTKFLHVFRRWSLSNLRLGPPANISARLASQPCADPHSAPMQQASRAASKEILPGSSPPRRSGFS